LQIIAAIKAATIWEESMSEATGSTGVTGGATELHGAAKKEAFHLAAEALIRSFAFTRPEGELEPGRKMHIKLAGTDTCRAQVQILKKGGENNLHYHPNMDLIYMVLKGRVTFYGPGDKVLGSYGPFEGLLLPENSRYWFGSEGDEEAYLLQIAGYPKGAKMSRRINSEPLKETQQGSQWYGVTKEEEDFIDKYSKPTSDPMK
jgi:quercetin dioxygenase-like cupin family protein